MNCDEIQALLCAIADGECPLDARDAVLRHVSECRACAEFEATLDDLDRQLKQISPAASAIDRIAAGAIANWSRSTAAVSAQTAPVKTARGGPASTSLGRFGLLATALGLLIGILIWWNANQNQNVPPVADNPIEQPREEDRPILPQLADDSPVGVASLVQTTGTVEVKYVDQENWLPVSFTPFACPSDASVRTGEDSLCEVETTSGGLVRLDEHATVHVRSADEIELEAGRVWCKAPDDGDLQITPALGEMPVPDIVDADTCLSIPLLCCPSSCSMQAELTESSELQVHALEGLIDVNSDPFDRQLNSGEAVQIVAGRVDREFEEDTLLAMRWMLPLVARDSVEVESFTQRVLASIGGAKTGFIYEEDLIRLGEPGAVPLLAFLQVTPAEERIEARRTAANVLSQTAGESMIDDLIDLLSDEDGDVRVAIAMALQRLTGETHGVDPEEWRYGSRETEAAHSAWQTWRDMQ